MRVTEVCEKLRANGLQVWEMEPMSKHTTLRLGGPADLFCAAGDVQEIRLCLQAADAAGLPVTLVGQGSNLLVRDGGIRGLVLKCALTEVVCRGTEMEAGAGCLLSVLAEKAARQSLSGLAFASGIPGTLGGAVFMNAGAYNGEIGDRFVSASALTLAGEAVELSKDDLRFSYRYSALQDSPLILTSVRLALENGEENGIREEMRELARKRQEKQPLNYPSAGSTFKRPEGDFAARLIDVCGLRGYRIGGAEVSEKHAGFLLNRGGTAADFLALMEFVQTRVFEQTGVRLSPEVRILGEE